MKVNQLILTNFKNYEVKTFDFVEGMNLIVGLNGVGKTNLLDSIYYLCMCKSRFAGSDRNILRKVNEEKADFFRLESHFKKKKKKLKVVAKVQPSKKIKDFEINDKAAERLADHIGILPVVMVVPDDSLLLLDGSESRRLLIDNVLSQMERPYLNALMAYNRILKQRNAALKGFIENRNYDAALVRTYNEQLCPLASTIHELRSDFMIQFSHYLNQFYQQISGEKETISCEYKSGLNDEKPELIFERTMEKDRYTGRTTEGIHKDDLIFKMDDFPLKRFASQGQLKSFILSAKLAQYELLRLHKGVTPLLLLDDIFAKLDDQRVAHLLKLLNHKNFEQVFITDTHTERGAKILEEAEIEFQQIELE